MSEITISGGGLKEALTIKFTDSPPPQPEDAAIKVAIVKMLKERSRAPKDSSGVPYTKPVVGPYVG